MTSSEVARLIDGFTQTDPQPLGAGSAFESAYVYALNNPLVYTDPTGMRSRPTYQRALDLIGSEMPTNSAWAQKYGIDSCHWPAGYFCYKEQLAAKGKTFASKVADGMVWDYKTQSRFLTAINHEQFTNIDPDLNPIAKTSISVGSDTWGNVHYGWIGRVFKLQRGDLMDASHGFVSILGPIHKKLAGAGATQSADDEAVRAGFEMYDRCGEGCGRSDLDVAIRQVAPKLIAADMKDGTPGAHARKT